MVASSKELQHWRIEIGIKLARACLDSKLLYNAETWTKVKKSDIKKLETAQTTFFKILIGVPIGTPNVAITEELGVLPVEYKIESKQLMEYHWILKMGEENLPKKTAFKAKEMGSNNLLTIMRKHNINITCSETEVMQMTVKQWKRLVCKIKELPEMFNMGKCKDTI